MCGVGGGGNIKLTSMCCFIPSCCILVLSVPATLKCVCACMGSQLCVSDPVMVCCF